MTRVLASSLLLSGLFASTGCAGGGCQYADALGTATILSVDSSTSGCPKDPVRVIFRFVPTDTTLSTTETFNLTVGDGKDPARAWVTASGLTVGSTHKATRSTRIAGACSPLSIKLTDLDYMAANAACF